MQTLLLPILFRLSQELTDRIGDKEPSLYLYGSAVLEDFRPGWSDIDVLILTETPLEADEAESLVTLRQELVGQTGEPLFRNLEGAILHREAFVTGASTPVVYWGTSGQRLQDAYPMDPFSLWLLHKRGLCLLGEDRRHTLPEPDFAALREGVRHHYETIRRYAQTTQANLYAFGWMLDIARGLYTLHTGQVTSKTQAALWVQEQNLCPVPQALQTALSVRQNPSLLQTQASLRLCAQNLGPAIQRFADVLEEALLSQS